ncbi:TPA: MFS transporter [Streptococcus pneumoniae]|nr:MFS transporter [Streptococcus pneumoniae]
MNRYAVQLISRGAINKMGNMLYDYGNSVWLASMGTIGQTVLGMYQISELVTSILVNPFGGVISDRFSRRKILMTADLVCGILCLAISFIRNDSWMIGALIVANIVQAIAFVLVAFLPKEEAKVQEKKAFTGRDIFVDIKDGLHYIWHQQEIFFLLLVASSVNFFFAAFEFLLPFSNQLYGSEGAYASILTMGAIGSIIGALLASKIKANIYNLLILLALTGVGVFMMGLPLPTFLSFSGNLVCELFMTIFNIHFFTQVQTKVESEFLGRVLSTIFTLAILFMPIAKGFMTVLPSVHLSSFLIIGSGVIILSCISFIYVRTHFEKLI